MREKDHANKVVYDHSQKVTNDTQVQPERDLVELVIGLQRKLQLFGHIQYNAIQDEAICSARH